MAALLKNCIPALLLLVLVAGDGSAASPTPAPATAPGGKAGCQLVECLVDPCTTTTCKPPGQWECVANYCGGCNTNWKHKNTGYVITECPPSFCPANYAPVCGVNGKTYSNSCFATINGVKVAYQGACMFPTACATYKAYKPICDSNGNTWPNTCVARLNGITKYTAGACLGGACAKCLPTAGCNGPHRCNGNPRYKCTTSSCATKHVLDSGARVTYGLCKPVYVNRATGYPVVACYP